MRNGEAHFIGLRLAANAAIRNGDRADEVVLGVCILALADWVGARHQQIRDALFVAERKRNGCTLALPRKGGCTHHLYSP
jgi:hypothetical protein